MKQEIERWSLIRAIIARLLCIVASWIESTAQYVDILSEMMASHVFNQVMV